MASTAVSLPARRTANMLVLLLGAALFLNYVDRGAIAVAAPLMKGEFKLSATDFGLAVSAFFWVYAPVQLIRRLAVRPLLRLSAHGGSASCCGPEAPS